MDTVWCLDFYFLGTYFVRTFKFVTDDLLAFLRGKDVPFPTDSSMEF